MTRKIIVQVVDRHQCKDEDEVFAEVDKLEQAGYCKSIISWGKYRDNGYPDLYVVLIKEESNDNNNR